MCLIETMLENKELEKIYHFLRLVHFCVEQTRDANGEPVSRTYEQGADWAESEMAKLTGASDAADSRKAAGDFWERQQPNLRFPTLALRLEHCLKRLEVRLGR